MQNWQRMAADRLTQLQDAVNLQAENFCNSIGILQMYAKESSFAEFNSITNKQQCNNTNNNQNQNSTTNSELLMPNDISMIKDKTLIPSTTSTTPTTATNVSSSSSMKSSTSASSTLLMNGSSSTNDKDNNSNLICKNINANNSLTATATIASNNIKQQQQQQTTNNDENSQLFARLIARTAKDIDTLIESLPNTFENEHGSSDLHSNSIRQLELDNSRLIFELENVIKRGELLLDIIRNALDEIALMQLKSQTIDK